MFFFLLSTVFIRSHLYKTATPTQGNARSGDDVSAYAKERASERTRPTTYARDGGLLGPCCCCCGCGCCCCCEGRTFPDPPCAPMPMVADTICADDMVARFSMAVLRMLSSQCWFGRRGRVVFVYRQGRSLADAFQVSSPSSSRLGGHGVKRVASVRLRA